MYSNSSGTFGSGRTAATSSAHASAASPASPARFATLGHVAPGVVSTHETSRTDTARRCATSDDSVGNESTRTALVRNDSETPAEDPEGSRATESACRGTLAGVSVQNDPGRIEISNASALT